MRKGDRLLQLGFGGGETPISLLSITQSKAFETPGISTSGTLQRRTISAHPEEMSHSAASCQGLLCVQWGPLCPLVTRLCVGYLGRHLIRHSCHAGFKCNTAVWCALRDVNQPHSAWEGSVLEDA